MGNEASSGKGSPQTASSTSASNSPDGDVGVPVILHVYNLQGANGSGSTTLNQSMGFGVYHSGIEIFGMEVAFGGNQEAPPDTSGVFALRPKTILPIQQHHASHVLGKLPHEATTGPKLQKALMSIASDWKTSSYHLFNHNCNHFATAFVDAISQAFGIPMEVPAYVNRAARVGGAFCPEALYRAMMQKVPQAPRGGGPDPFASAVNGGSTQAKSNSSPAPSRSSTTSSTPAASSRPPAATAAGTSRPSAPPPPIPEQSKLQKMSAKELKELMRAHAISDRACLEKGDLISAIESARPK